MNPEQWRRVVENAVMETGHDDEVVVGLETTPQGWRVFLLPPQQVAAQVMPEETS